MSIPEGLCTGPPSFSIPKFSPRMEEEGDEVSGEEREGEVVRVLIFAFEIPEDSIFAGRMEYDRGEEQWLTPDEDPGTLREEMAGTPLFGVSPLAALLRRARAWEMESRELAARSSSSESERQMASEGEEGGLHAGAGKAGEAEVDPTPGAGLCVQLTSWSRCQIHNLEM